MKYSKRNKIALFLLATILFMQSVLFPITTYASTSGYVDSLGDNYEYYPGELYWAGTEERTTLLVYLVNNKTGQYLGNDYAIMLFQGDPDQESLLDSNGEPWLTKVTKKGGTIRCGNKDSAYAIFTNSRKWKDGSEYNMPAVASFISNPDGIKNWLEETLDESDNLGITGLRMIDKIVIKTMGYDAFKKTCPSESGEPEYAVVFESCSANMIYRNVRQDSQGVWICTPDMNYSLTNLQQNIGDPRAYYWGTPRSHAQWLMNPNDRYSPFISNAGIHSDIQTGSGKNGIANWKWYQSYFRYFGVTKDYWGGVIKGQKKKADELVTLGEAYTYGWAVGVAEPPQIPIGTCNDSTPGNTEEITEYTKGNKIIYKGYYTKKIHADGTSDIEDVKVFKRQGTTNWILLEAEDKNGYTMKCYKPSNSTTGLTATKNIREQYSTRVTGTSYGGVSTDTPINLNDVNGKKYNALYILYEKVVDDEEDETLDGQFEIAESQISKRVSFADTSVTNTLNSHEFTLTSKAFDEQHDHVNHTHGVGCYDADGKLTCTTPTTVKCTPGYTLGSKTIKFAIKFSNSDSYPSIIAKSEYVKTTKDTSTSMTSTNQSQSYTRGTTAQDTAKFSGFNQIALLFRGQDKLTLANWKNSSAGVEESFLTTIASNGTYNFKSSNAPQGSRKNKSYVETFSANWNTDTDTNVTSLQTSATCDGGGTGSGTTVYKPYENTNIDYKIDNIKVNVKVFWAKAEKASTNTKVPEVASKLTAGAVSFRPYIKMRYDRNVGLADNRGFSKSNYVYVLAQSNSNMLVGVTANDYSNVSISGSADGAINISSTQFSTHNKAIEYIAGQFGVSTADVMNNMNHYKILPGGATFSISIPKDRTRTVTITTYQAYLPSGGAGYTQMQATGGSTTLETDTTKLVSNHKTFANAVRSTFAGTRIIQFVTTNTTDNLSTVLGGTAVKGGVSFAGVTLSSDSKYYFSNFSATNLDVSDVSEPSQAYYTFFVNTKGEVRCVQGTTVSGESDGQLIAAKGSDSVSGSGVAATIAKKTGIVTNLRQSLIDNVGNDTGAGWAPDGKWYNEAFDGITYLVQTSSFQIGMWNPTERQTVLDPKLTPAQSSKEDFFTNAYSTAFVSNNNSTTVGTFRNSAGNSYSQKYNFSNLFNSEVIFIPNVTTQDLN